ncbi:site-2 protease family protein [Planomicrobium okeanokoites]|uniref:site-2 protease family protein n=1 Tax=Planomicrobium okeanokoites TaxID=244 RepID=UPI002492C682|nr:site-2 protease family protein [Planomicrobium okeanokoites]
MFVLEVVTVLFVMNAVLFIHEIGHAIPVLLRNKKARVEIYLGPRNKEQKLELRLGRLTCYLTIAFSGLCRVANSDELPSATPKQNLLFSACGPIASLIVFILFLYLSSIIPGIPGNIFNSAAFMSLSVFLFTAIPITYPSFFKNLGGHKSDGWYILKNIKEIKNQAKTIA